MSLNVNRMFKQFARKITIILLYSMTYQQNLLEQYNSNDYKIINSTKRLLYCEKKIKQHNNNRHYTGLPSPNHTKTHRHHRLWPTRLL